jgi:hypothetical protein
LTFLRTGWCYQKKTITLDAYIEAVLPKANGDGKFQANLKNDYGQPIATVQVYYWNSQTYPSAVPFLVREKKYS